VEVKSHGRVQLFATPWTAAYQAPPSMGFSKQGYWSGVPLPSPVVGAMQVQFFFFLPHHTTHGILIPQPGIEPEPLAVEPCSLFHWSAREVLECFKLNIGS